MKPPICAICNQDFEASDGGLVYFQQSLQDYKANKRFEQEDFVGHPAHAVWFCPQHYQQARTLAHLTRKAAMLLIKRSAQNP